MSETPLAQNKVISNDSGILTGTYAYSPHPSNIQENTKQQQSHSSESIEKILSTSIQRAKQKITMLEGRHKQERGDSRQERASSKDGNGNNSAIATAMKVLQMRVYELQKLVQGLQKQKGIILKELDNLTSEKKMILTNLEQANKKNSQLQQTNKAIKAQSKDLNRKLEDALSKNNDYQGRCQGLQMTIRHLETDKMQLSMSMSKKEESSVKQSPSHKQVLMKAAQLQQKYRLMHERQKKLQQKQRKLAMIEIQMKEKQGRIMHEVKRLIEENNKMKAQIQKASTQLVQSKNKEVLQKENYEVYLRKINDMESQIQQLRETTKRMEHEEPQPNKDDLDEVQDKLRQFQNKYEQLLHLFRRGEEKSKRDEKQIKLLKDRIREVQDLLADIVEKIGKLPTCTKELKYLSVKGSKLISNAFERAINLKTPTKSRSSSLNRSISRSNSQRKNTLHSQLENYQNSNRSNKGKSNSKQKSKIESDSKRKSGSKTKRIVVSQSGCEPLEKQITELKKQYKKLVKLHNENESEDIRNKLNDIAFLIQEKSEKLTKMKQTKLK